MKRLFIILPILALLLGISSAKAQSPVQIEGSTFYVYCDQQTMTAEICDNDYRIDDREFPMYFATRRINGLPKKGENTLNIPEKVKVGGKEYTITAIGRAAFAGYRNFHYVNIPSTVQSIGEYAFYRTQITSVDIPISVTSIAKRAFGYCEMLRTIYIPHEGYAIENGVYDGDVAVKTVAEEQQRLDTSPLQATADVDANIPTTSTVNDQTFVVVFANEAYKSEENANYALNDGRAFKQYCTSTLGVPGKNIHIVENATLAKMRSEINWLSRVAAVYEGEARIIVYYAGHGIPDENSGNAYLLPVDGVSTDMQSAYSLKSFYAELSKMGAQSVTLFMDACFCGAQRGEGNLSANYDAPIATREEAPVGNLVVFSATQKDETALIDEESKHGVFTYFLLKKLQETAGEVSYQELASYLKRQVSRYAIVVNDTQQTPTMRASNTMSGNLGEMKLK